MRKHVTPGVVLGIIALCVAMSGSAVAGSLITSAKIKDGTIRNKDIKKGTIALNRLSKSARKAIRLAAVAGPQGAKGASGAAGATGATGAAGAPGQDGAPGTTLQPSRGPAPLANWGLMNRNTIGSASALLRVGPLEPPYGDGSLNLTVGAGTDKVAFGDDVDSVAGGLLHNVKQVGYHVFTTGENSEVGPNMPSIIFEIDPNSDDKPAANYASLVYVPAANSASNEWSDYIDATKTGTWGLSGGTWNNTTCSLNTASCTWDEVQAYLDQSGDPATILSVMVSKGRDHAWSGAVDGLRVNDTVFDFERDGVFTTTP
jgi:hypothetical protein